MSTSGMSTWLMADPVGVSPWAKGPMDGSERGTFGPSPPSSVPTVLAVKGIAPETALAACGGASVAVCSNLVVPPAGAQLPAGVEITCIAPGNR